MTSITMEFTAFKGILIENKMLIKPYVGPIVFSTLLLMACWGKKCSGLCVHI
ncbi:hypothetical protein NC652_014400 [Populus alba x Populus x berolinensis]|nr:hypothetical protein NC652_014400 [Populus alba x Populus x berolinensis]